MLIPLAIINHFKPTRELPPNKHLHELYPAGTEGNDFTLRARSAPSYLAQFFPARRSRPEDARAAGTIARCASARWRKRNAGWSSASGEGSDGLAAVFPAMLNSIIALRALDYPKDHPLYQKALRDFEGLFVDDPEDFRIQPCLSPVWDTAINIIALAESGFPAQHPALCTAPRSGS